MTPDNFRYVDNHTGAHMIAYVLEQMDQHQTTYRGAIEADAARYYTRKRDDKVENDVAVKDKPPVIVPAPALKGNPLANVVIGDRVIHGKTGLSFIVLEVRGDEIAVKGDNVPRMTFLRESLRKP